MRFLSLACALAMGLGALVAARLAYAETVARQDTVPALKRAAELDRFAPPAPYFEWLAELDPDHAVEWLDAAIQANPRSTSAWIAKGHEEERLGAVAEAERSLLQGASIDHRYLPAWTLSNFYFRQDRRDDFWVWARRAALLTYDDFRPLLKLAHALEPNPEAVIGRLGAHAGEPSESLLHAELDYLAEQGQLEDAQRAARILLARHSPADKPRILELAERQIRAGQAQDALELWNAVRNAGSPPLDPSGSISANGDFATAPSGMAFDWRLLQGDGFRTSWTPGEIAVELSGDQPEQCVLAEQRVALRVGVRYRLRYEYRTHGLTAPTGLLWELTDAGKEERSDSISSAEIWSAEIWRMADTVFSPAKPQPAADALTLATLWLLYRRETGAMRAAGEIRLRRLRLEAL